MQSIENTINNSNILNLSVSTGAFIEFDWTDTGLGDIDGFLFGSDSIVSRSFVVGTDRDGLSPHPNIKLDRDCTGPSCSEVILITVFQQRACTAWVWILNLPTARRPISSVTEKTSLSVSTKGGR